jgi:putative tryptophan/tyrosine transport system substrate-binding protein
MTRRIVFSLLLTVLLPAVFLVEAQQAKVYRVGVIHQGGPYKAVVDGLRDGLKQSGYEDGKQILLEIRDTKSDLKLVEEAAKTFEREKINLIYAVATSVVSPVKNVTSQIPIVFSVGSDPVASGLVQSFGRPGGRLTGIQYSTTDLTGKRLEILKEILPKLSRVVTFYNPNNRSAIEAAALAREAARQFRVQLVERHATSVEELPAP